jgi:hypothetical protein
MSTEAQEIEAFDKLENATDEEIMSMPLPKDEVVEDDYDTTEDEQTTEQDVDDTDIVDNNEELDQEQDDNEDTSNAQDDDGTTDEVEEEDTTDTSDSENQLAQLFAPFRANGREMKVENIGEAISLMQMGANFNKKMNSLKPNLKIVKMLENNGLLDADKINYLIDLDKKNPDAIAKLIKDSEFDTYAHSEDTDYTPNTYGVSDGDMQLEDTLNDIRGSKGYSQTLSIITDKWDEESKNVLLSNPSAIKQINEHVELGIYDQIEAKMERDKVLGKLSGMSDLDAYKLTGDLLNEQGAFDSVAPKSAPKRVTKASKVDSEARKRKLAASSNKSTPTAKVKADYNPLAMSDEESEVAFQKLMGGKFV